MAAPVNRAQIDRPSPTILERLALEAIGVILLFVVALGILNRLEFGSFD